MLVGAVPNNGIIKLKDGIHRHLIVLKNLNHYSYIFPSQSKITERFEIPSAEMSCI